jgi:hypothetical protein
MAIYKFSNVGGFGTYQRYNDFLAGNPTTPVYVDDGAYFPLGEFTLASAQSSVVFSNIPQTYSHLQLRMCAGSNSTAANDQVILRFNSDASSSNYTTHYIQGNGSAASAYGFGTGGFAGAYLDKAITGNSTTTFGVGVIDLLDYKITNKNKTMRSLHGYDANGSGVITLESALWTNSSTAISSITLVLNSSSTFRINSNFALYGVLA